MNQFEDFDNEFEFDEFEEEYCDSPLSFSEFAIKETNGLLDRMESDYFNPNDYGDHAYYCLPGVITDIMEIKYELSKEFRHEKPSIRCSFYYKNMYRSVMDEIRFHPAHLNILFEQQGEHAFEILGY